MVKAITASSFVAVMLISGLAPAQTSDTAFKQFESGLQFYEQGRYKQALSDFEIVASMGDSEYSDDALLKIGEYYLEIAGDYEKAREYFDQILQNYATKDAAPGAYYYIGLVTMRSSFEVQALDDATANFQRVIRLYPESPWVPAAHFSTGTALERRGAWQEAVDAYFLVISDYPDSAWAAEAQLDLGWCLVRLGDPMQAMIEIQRVRTRYPETTEADEAVDWLTHLFRFYGYRELGKPVSYRADSSFRPAVSDKFKDVKAVRVSSKGIYVLEQGRKRVLTFELDGKLAGTQAAADPYGLFVDPRDTVVVANKKGLLIDGKPFMLSVPEEKGPKPLDDVRMAVRDRLGDIYVYDDDAKNVLRFDASGGLKGPFPETTPREILALDLDRNGNIIMLEKRNRTISVFSPAGRRVARIDKRGEGFELKKPVDIAVDPAGYFYVLDSDRAQVAVFDPSYTFLTLLSDNNFGGGALKKPVALDVDSSGDIYVYDEDAKTIFRFH
jgi:TolA-binding protein